MSHPAPSRRGRSKVTFIAVGLAAVMAVGIGVAEFTGVSSSTKAPHSAGSPVAAVKSGPKLVIPTKAELLNPAADAKYFGIAAPGAPWKSAVMRGIKTQAGGVSPNMVEYFVNWTKNFDPAAVQVAYAQHAVPVVTWEPWAGSSKGTKQPDYSLATIIDGKHDAYITAFAEAVKKNRWPVALRLGHEMNGHWYPWAEHNGVNKPGQFVKAWKHIHDVFAKVGVDNVIWVWAPNTLRGADGVSLKSLYPGDAYVDWVGISAYDVTETTADKVLGPTLRDIRAFTKRPLLITETGSQPGPQKAEWTTNLFQWVKAHNDVVGFIWFQYTKAQGGGTNWTFASSQPSETAFRAGVKTLKLAKVSNGKHV